MRERFQHWYDASLADPRQRISAVWFVGRGRPHEKHAPLQPMLLLVVPAFLLAFWNVVSLPILWKEWRLSHELTDSLTLVDDGIVSLIVTHDNLPLDSVFPSATQQKNVAVDYQPNLSHLLYPYTLSFEPDLHPARKVDDDANKEIVEAVAVNDVAEDTAAQKVAQDNASQQDLPKVIEGTPSAPQEIVRIGQWKQKANDAGVEIEFNVGNRGGGKLSGYLWGLATFETENGEMHTVAVPDAVFSSDDHSPDYVKDAEHFATRKFRRTRWNLEFPVAEPGKFTRIIVGVADEDGNEILREEHKM